MKVDFSVGDCRQDYGDRVVAVDNVDRKIIRYKYNEDEIINDLKSYIDKTYNEHYKTTDNIECFDAWIALGNASTTFRDTAIKYLWRIGKKGSDEDQKKDLLKALHYVILCLYNQRIEKVK